MKISGQGVVCSGARGSARSSCAFPGVAVLGSGRWICGFRAAPTKASVPGQRALLAWSDDQGAHWSEPAEPFVPPVMDGRLGAFRALQPTALGGSELLATLYWVDVSDPSLPFFNEETQGLLDSRLFTAISRDGGARWGELRRVDTSPYDVPTPITGPTLLLPSGEWACQFELNKHYEDTSVWRHASVMKFSRDRGASWPEHAVVAQDPTNRVFTWDQRPGLLGDGTLLDLFWTYDTATATYLPIHAAASRDNGRSWTAPWDTGLAGQPAPPLSLREGRILCVYVDRTASPCIKARVSRDGGKRFTAESELLIHGGATRQTRDKSTMQDAWAEMGAFSIGLPTTTALPDGDVLVIYYAGPETDLTDIRWCRLRAE